MKRFILASASPRRKEILEKGGYEFEIIVSDKEGNTDKFSNPEKLAVRFASQKAEDIFKKVGKDAVILAADTVVALDGKVYGKPHDEEEARTFLRELSGKTHQVITGYSIISDDFRETGHVVSNVTFNERNDDLIDKYVKTGSPLDKAGAYGIQDESGLIKGYEGSLDNIIGLPLEEISETLDELLK